VGWRADGKELFFVAPGNQLMAAPLIPLPDAHTITVSAPVTLFQTMFKLRSSAIQDIITPSAAMANTSERRGWGDVLQRRGRPSWAAPTIR
jgi:hypothetical protein